MTIGEFFSKAKNYNFSAHTFSTIAAILGIGYAGSPELQDLVHDFVTHSKPWVRALLIAGVAIYARYAPAKAGATITVQPGESAVGAIGVESESK